MPRVRTFQLALGFVLVFGLMVLSFWSGTTISDWPQRDPNAEDTAAHDVYGYVSVKATPSAERAKGLVGGGDASDVLAVELRTQATLLQSRTLLASVLQKPSLEIRNTEWFKSFKHPAEARRWLERHFHADALPETRIIRVWLDPIDQPRLESRTIVMDIVNTHIEEQRKLTQVKTLERTAALNQLKTKYEIRMRELSDRRNNLMLRTQVINAGWYGRTTATDLELAHAIPQSFSQVSANASAHEKLERWQANKDNVDPAALSTAEEEAQNAAASLEATTKRIESLKSVSGDLAIAMSECATTEEELGIVRNSLRDVRDQMDVISASNSVSVVDWAQFPSARDDN